MKYFLILILLLFNCSNENKKYIAQKEYEAIELLRDRKIKDSKKIFLELQEKNDYLPTTNFYLASINSMNKKTKQTTSYLDIVTTEPLTFLNFTKGQLKVNSQNIDTDDNLIKIIGQLNLDDDSPFIIKIDSIFNYEIFFAAISSLNKINKKDFLVFLNNRDYFFYITANRIDYDYNLVVVLQDSNYLKVVEPSGYPNQIIPEHVKKIMSYNELPILVDFLNNISNEKKYINLNLLCSGGVNAKKFFSLLMSINSIKNVRVSFSGMVNNNYFPSS